VSPSRPQPEFFVDRSLGRHQVAAALRTAGWRIRSHFEVFGSRDEAVPDVEWLELCGRDDLVVLTSDRRLRYQPREIAAIRRNCIRAFVVGASLRAVDQAARLERNREAILGACAERGPFVYAVQTERIVRVFPR
jgi:hypothetical protein